MSPMGYIYKLMALAKKNIAFNCKPNEKKCEHILKKHDKTWSIQLHQPIHVVGYYLNPQSRFENNFSSDEEVKQGLAN